VDNCKKIQTNSTTNDAKEDDDMTQYEYKVVVVKVGIFTDSDAKQEKQLNELGAEGWKLVSVFPSKNFLKYVFIRER